MPQSLDSVNVSSANDRAVLRMVSAPWVEFQLLTAEPSTILADATINRPQPANGLNFKHFTPATAGDLIMLYANQYKKTLMVFRWVANAILHSKGIRETRPTPAYRRPALEALADAIKKHFLVIQPGLNSGLRNPLRLLVEIVYENNRACRDDEAALLFLMFAEAVGVPCKFVIVKQDKGWRSYVECQLDVQSDWMAFDFLSGQWGVAPQGKKYAFTADGGPSTVGRSQEFIDNQVYGEFAIPRELIGSYNLSASRWWREPKIRPIWFAPLNKALQNQPTNFNDPFLVNKYFDHPRVNVAENFGPEMTGAIIAKAAQLQSQRYGRIFASIVRDAANAFNLDLYDLQGLRQGQLIADLIRTTMPYAEETVGVEELTDPKRMWWFYCFYPGVQKYDCDDLTTCWMTMAESIGLTTGVRLAGDAGKTDKYHVYPLYLGPDVKEPYVFDVSAPTPWGVEMNRGNNFRDYFPKDPATYEPVLSRNVAAGFKAQWATGNSPFSVSGGPRKTPYTAPPSRSCGRCGWIAGPGWVGGASAVGSRCPQCGCNFFYQ